MTPTPQTNPSQSQDGGLFRTTDGKNLFVTFAWMTSFFVSCGDGTNPMPGCPRQSGCTVNRFPIKLKSQLPQKGPR
jgi:hypothetical protein